MKSVSLCNYLSLDLEVFLFPLTCCLWPLSLDEVGRRFFWFFGVFAIRLLIYRKNIFVQESCLETNSKFFVVFWSFIRDHLICLLVKCREMPSERVTQSNLLLLNLQYICCRSTAICRRLLIPSLIWRTCWITVAVLLVSCYYCKFHFQMAFHSISLVSKLYEIIWNAILWRRCPKHI